MDDGRRYPPPICAWCGKFASPRTVKVNYTPDTDFSAERVEYKCARCVAKEKPLPEPPEVERG